MAPEDVTVHVTLLGGGFGRKSKPDFVFEAAECSRAMDGAPVKLTWTREDDIRHGYYHTVSVEKMSGGLDEGGSPVAWLHRTAAPTIESIFAPDPKHQLPFELGMGLLNMPLAIENIRAENPEAAAHVRIGWYRAVSNLPHAFAIQSFVSELAHAAGRDPKDYLLEVIGPARRIDPTEQGDVWNYGEDPDTYPIDTGRMAGVVEAAAKGIEWGREVPEGAGLHIAGHYSFVSYVAVACEVAVEDGAVSVPRVCIAIDCGAHVNPDRIRSQMEGAVIMGVGQALMTEVTFADGRAQQGNFDGYLIPRMEDAPGRTDVELVSSGADYDQYLGGVGEPACRRWRRRSPTRSSPPRAGASAGSPSPTNCAPDREPPMNAIAIASAALAAALLSGPASAHDCLGRIGEIEALLDATSEEAIATSSGGQAVAGARQAQAADGDEEGLEEPVVPVQDEREEAIAVEEAEEAGRGGERVVEARTALQDAREMAEGGDEEACLKALNDMILAALRD